MEDPANKLDLDEDLRIIGDNKFKIVDMKEKICKALIDEEHTINEEIRNMKLHKLTRQEIESGEVEIEGISYTSILTYLNESKLKNESDMSHK